MKKENEMTKSSDAAEYMRQIFVAAPALKRSRFARLIHRDPSYFHTAKYLTAEQIEIIADELEKLSAFANELREKKNAE